MLVVLSDIRNKEVSQLLQVPQRLWVQVVLAVRAAMLVTVETDQWRVWVLVLVAPAVLLVLLVQVTLRMWAVSQVGCRQVQFRLHLLQEV